MVPEKRPVHVVVVAYGEPGRLEACLDALGGNYPVVVVDNSSSPEVRALATRHGAHYLDTGENVGFAAAVNLGLAGLPLSDTDVLLLNPDAVIEPEAVEKLRNRLHASARVACVAPAQHRPGSTREATVRWPFPSPGLAWVEALGLGRFIHRWGYVIASVMLVNGDALVDVGGFDEGFFLYAEEADWERRVTRRGWQIAFCPEAVATHVGAATDTDSRRREMRFHAGVERYVRKWHGAFGWRTYQLATVLTAIRRALPRGGERRASSLHLAAMYSRGPYRAAIKAGVVPRRRHSVPDLSGDTEKVSPRRVLLVDSIGYEELGGASTVLNEIIARLDRSMFVPVLACLSTGRWPEMVRASGTAAYSLPRTRLRSVRNTAKVVLGLRDVIRTERIDLIHASENTALPYAALAATLTRTPAIWHVHSPLRAKTREERVVARVLRWLRPVRLVFTSEAARDKSISLPRVPWTVINPGVDLARCRSGDRGRGRTSTGIPDDALVISMFARVEPMKGEIDFVECMGRLAPRYPALYALMCGPGDRDGSYWRRLDEVSREHHLDGRLLMPGDVRSPLKEDLVAASDVVVHPSHAESFGLAVLEAMAAGRPVVSADTDGARLLIRDGENGLVVPIGDVDAFASAVSDLLDDPATRGRLASAASESAERYEVEQMVRRFEELWTDVLAGRSPT